MIAKPSSSASSPTVIRIIDIDIVKIACGVTLILTGPHFILEQNVFEGVLMMALGAYALWCSIDHKDVPGV